MWFEIEFQNYRCFDEKTPARLALQPVVTSLVGPNNSGKSALLRFFYEARLFFRLLTNANPIINMLRDKEGLPGFQQIADPDEVLSYFGTGDLRITFKACGIVSGELGTKIPKAVTLVIERETHTCRLEIPHQALLLRNCAEAVWQADRIHWKLGNGAAGELVLAPYIQLWRELENSMYVGPVRHIGNQGGIQYDISIGQELVNKWKQFKGGATIKQHQVAQGLEEDVRKMFQFNALEINVASNDVELLAIIDKRTYYLQRIGAGISQVLVMLINLAVRQPPYLFIDEPELNLHPALQTQFVKALYSRVQRGLIFATHSIGLARETADIIYTVSKTPGAPSVLTEHTPGARLSEILGEMNFSSLRELGFEKVLLVEGPTEVKVFQSFLDILGIPPRRILLVPLGGTSMINGSREDELAELTRITNDPSLVVAVIDSERTAMGGPAKPEHVEFERICHKLSIKCKLLDRRATDNYFTDRAVKATLGSAYSALGEFVRLKDMNPHWDKKENWKIAAKMTKDELAPTDLGHFLLSMVP